MPHTLTKAGDLLEVKLEGRWSDISDAKDKVREVPGRRWDPVKKVWTVPADPQIADRILKSIRPDTDESLMAWIRESMTHHEESLTAPIPDDSNNLLVPWAYQRAPWQPEQVNDEKVVGLLPQQRAAVDAMASWTRALLCDDMGLGKTFMAISAVEEWRLRNGQADGPKLIVAPASVMGGWARELNRWLKDPAVVIADGASPAKRHTQISEAILADAWLIVNWEQLRIKKIEAKTSKGGKKTLTVMKEPLFQYPEASEWGLSLDEWDVPAHAKAARQFGKAQHWLAVLADEIHRAKSKDAQQTQGLHRTSGQLMAGMTGTPIMNSPDELWALMRWLWPAEYHERGESYSPGAMAYWPFYDMFVDYWEDHFGRKIITGVKNAEGLRYALKGKVIRRTAPAGGRKRFYYDVPLTPKQQKLYDEAEKSMWLAIEKDAVAGNKEALELVAKAAEGASVVELMRIPNGAARFVRLQQIIENAALLGGPDESAVMDDFEQKFQDSRPYQWVVFTKYKMSCDLLADRLRKKFGATVETYTGDVSPADRTEIENAYQRGEVDVIVGTIDALYQGITLTAGHLQHWLSRDVVPAKNEQGEARQDRKGQQKMVNVYIPQAPDTVATDKVHVINRLKENIVKTVIPQVEIEEAA